MVFSKKNLKFICKRNIFCLYLRPSFFEGLARLFDFPGYLIDYNYSRSSREADLRAVSSDWQHVGEDISVAIQKLDAYLEIAHD